MSTNEHANPGKNPIEEQGANLGTSTLPGERVYFRDVKPYAVVDHLEDLQGPATGTVELDHSVLWAPGGGCVDISTEGGARLAYRAVLSEGTVEEQVKVLNRELLATVWARLTLPRRVRQMWESRFPELAALSEDLDRELTAAQAFRIAGGAAAHA